MKKTSKKATNDHALAGCCAMGQCGPERLEAARKQNKASKPTAKKYRYLVIITDEQLEDNLLPCALTKREAAAVEQRLTEITALSGIHRANIYALDCKPKYSTGAKVLDWIAETTQPDNGGWTKEETHPSLDAAMKEAMQKGQANLTQSQAIIFLKDHGTTIDVDALQLMHEIIECGCTDHTEKNPRCYTDYPQEQFDEDLDGETVEEIAAGWEYWQLWKQ